MTRLLTIVLVLITFSYYASATTLHVPADFPTIQAALDSALNLDVILVAAGTYYENIIWPNEYGTRLTLQGHSRYTTFINGGGEGSVIQLVSPDDSHNIRDQNYISDFTIENGVADDGGGICIERCSPTLQNLRIRNCSAEGEGGGIHINYGHPILDNLEIYDNIGGWMAGAISYRGDWGSNTGLRLSNSLIYRNQSWGISAVKCWSDSVKIDHCTFVDNYSTLNLSTLDIKDNAIVELHNSIFWFNPYFQLRVAGEAFISNCNIYGGEEQILVEDEGVVYWGGILLDEDPLFCDYDYSDYRLQLVSPCRTNVCGFMGYTGQTCDGESVESEPVSPETFDILRAYPNPFNPSTTIELNSTRPVEATVSIYNIRGQVVDVIHDGFLQAGNHTLTWQPDNLASGIYFVNLRSENQTETLKITYIE